MCILASAPVILLSPLSPLRGEGPGVRVFLLANSFAIARSARANSIASGDLARLRFMTPHPRPLSPGVPGARGDRFFVACPSQCVIYSPPRRSFFFPPSPRCGERGDRFFESLARVNVL